MNEPLFHPRARDELEEAAVFYEQRVPGLGKAFSKEVQHALQLILVHPEIGALLRSGFRNLAVRRFPFSVVYRGLGSGIFIVAIAHQRRRPGYWKKRVV